MNKTLTASMQEAARGFFKENPNEMAVVVTSDNYAYPRYQKQHADFRARKINGYALAIEAADLPEVKKPKATKEKVEN